MIPGGTRLALILTFAAAAAALLALAGLVLAAAVDLSEPPGAVEVVLVIAALAGLGALALAVVLVRGHFREIERLRGAVVTLADDPAAVPPTRPSAGSGAELLRLRGALADVAARYARERSLPDRRLQAVLAAIAEAMVVITDSGQVSLVNHAAKSLLGAERVRVGTSVFAALERPAVLEAVAEAGRRGRPVEAELPTVDGVRLSARVASLGDHGGAVLSFSPDEAAEHRAELEHSLELHDVPPRAGRTGGDTPLADLPVLVLDLETTGLDPARDHVVAVGAVRLHGARLYRSATIDRLVRPPVAIPPRSTAVHGVTDAMVADAAAFAEVFQDLRPLLDGTVVVGHHVTFDLAVLERECARAGIDWQRPPVLDTLLLAGALEPDREDLRLEALAAAYGVDVHGRHTALGDVLVTAQVFLRMLPLLADRGVATLAEADAFAGRRKDLLKAQAAAGF